MAGPIVGITVLGSSYLVGLPRDLRLDLGSWDLAQGRLGAHTHRALGFCMGRPSPTALALLGRRAPALIAWAYGINACASVIGAVLAVLCAIHLDLSVLLALALGCYLVALMAYSAMAEGGER